MEQVARKLVNREFHAPNHLHKAGLRRQQQHRRSRFFRVGAGDPRLQQRAKHRIERNPRGKLIGKLPFERQSVNVREQCRNFDEAHHQRIDGGIRHVPRFARSFARSTQQLHGKIAQDAPHPRHHFVTEHRTIVIAQQMPQDRAGSAAKSLGHRNFIAKHVLDRRA